MTPVGGASSATTLWDSIDWKATQSHVRRLQIRIAKAVREGRWGKVKALQRLLTHSHSAKLLAVRRVTQNRGRHTPYQRVFEVTMMFIQAWLYVLTPLLPEAITL